MDSIKTTSNTIQSTSLLYCLPKNSTSVMKQRIDDQREGLLGFANDEENYGTLWMVNDKGQAIVPKARAIEPELLFDGNASLVNTDYTLSSSYNGYTYLQVDVVFLGGGGNPVTQSLFIKTSNIIHSNDAQYIASGEVPNGANNFFIAFGFTSQTTFRIINPIINGWRDIMISRVYGLL